MDSRYNENPLDTYPEMVRDLFLTYVLPALIAAAIGFAAFVVIRYRRRRSAERQITGQDGSLTQLRTIKLKRGQRASDANPAMPAVTLLQLPAKKLIPTLKSPDGTWTYAGEDLDEPHVAILGRSGVGKNETLLDPAALNAIFYRPDPVIVNDVKGAMFRRFGGRISCRQYRYTFDPRHKRSSAVNLVQNRRMAEHTAAALYPIGGEKVKIYNRKARTVFLALVEDIGYEQASLSEVYRVASDPVKLKALAERDPRVGGVIGGENQTFAGDVTNSLTAPLEPLEDETVSRVFNPSPDQPTLSEKMVVWIVIPEGLEEVLGPLAGALLRNLYERAKAVPNSVRFMVDEAGSCLAFDDLARYMAVGRGRGVYFTLVLQDISQLVAKIGLDNTRSALGSAGVHYWGPSNDPATMRYVSELSGSAQVPRARYEHRGFSRTWRQFLTREGAPYVWEYPDRAAIEPQHVNGLPKGMWYRYAGDPHRIRLIIPAPMHEWAEKALPEKRRIRISGLPSLPKKPSVDVQKKGRAGAQMDAQPPEETLAQEPTSPEEPAAPRAEDPDEAAGVRDGRPAEDGAAPNGRACPSCELAISSKTARFCEDCGGRLHAERA